MIPKALLFDLDGVITDTARFHYLAWKKIADEYGLHFNQEDNERLKGVSRQRSFEIILEINDALDRFDMPRRREIETEKNNIYVELIKQLEEKDILPGIPAFLKEARKAGMKLAVASASKNAAAILRYLHLEDAFDYVADAGKISRSKPDPEVFLNCAQALGIAPEDCVGIEDSQAGIEAIHAGGMRSIGIGVVVTSIPPDVVLGATAELDFEAVCENLRRLG